MMGDWIYNEVAEDRDGLYHGLAAHKYSLEDREDTLKHLAKEDAFDQYTPEEAWYYRGLANQIQKNFREAVRCYYETLVCNPANWKAFEQAGICLKVALDHPSLGSKLMKMAAKEKCDNPEAILKKIAKALNDDKKKRPDLLRWLFTKFR
jgi:tetratricopeptide (TPR) repeat protein